MAKASNLLGVFGARNGYCSGDIALRIYKGANHLCCDRCNCNNESSETGRATVSSGRNLLPTGVPYTAFNTPESRALYTRGVQASKSTTNVGPAAGKAAGNACIFAIDDVSTTSYRQPTTLTSLSV